MSEELIAVAREEIEAFNADDWERFRATLAPDCVYEEPGTQRRVEGPDAIIEANQGWKSAYPDAQGTVTGAFACGDRVALEITWEGTQSGALEIPGGGEIAPTNRRVTLQACQVMRVADGKIVENRHFFDMLGMFEQLGAVSAEELAHAS
jgi:steroid delta-isomerase-like uncharacterized protein